MVFLTNILVLHVLGMGNIAYFNKQLYFGANHWGFLLKYCSPWSWGWKTTFCFTDSCIRVRADCFSLKQSFLGFKISHLWGIVREPPGQFPLHFVIKIIRKSMETGSKASRAVSFTFPYQINSKPWEPEPGASWAVSSTFTY